MAKQRTIFVGMSGGVDSSLAAFMLKQAGHVVVGVFIKVWHPDFLPCNWEAERLDAMRVAATLEIPFLTLDAEDVYKKHVADYFIAEYASGRTPNPDVMCNTFVKFGHFYDYARDRGADGIATGHYADTREEQGRTNLYMGADLEKDQTYFLWNVPETVLAHALFPVGRLKKNVVRREATRARIPVAEKKDSQGICFLGHVDIPEFLGHYIPLRRGAVLSPDGTTIGEHQGSTVYTIGQRHGFTINAPGNNHQPYFVIQKDLAANTITVSHNPPHVLCSNGSVLLGATNWIGNPPRVGDAIAIRTRYRQSLHNAMLTAVGEGTAEIMVGEGAGLPTVGQSCVVYQGTRCLGGGIIESVK